MRAAQVARAPRIASFVEELESRGLIESEPMAVDQNLDFTGSFSFSDLFGKKSDS